MSLLRNQAVNPLNNPATAAAPVETPVPQTVVEPVATTGYVQPIAVPLHDMGAGNLTVTAPNSMALAMPSSSDGGFDQLETGYGSFSHITLQTSVFELDGETMGSEFEANLSQSRPIYVFRDRKASDNSARVVYSYDKVTSNSGEPLAPIFQQWRNEGYDEPLMETRTEAVALVLSGPFAGQIALCSIPKTGTEKLAGYRIILERTKGRKIPDVITRVFAGSPVKLKSGGNFIPWNFEFAGDFSLQQAA